MVIAEAYAVGLPVIASNVGNMTSLIEHGRTGLHVRPGDPDDLAAGVEWASTHPEELEQIRKDARAKFESKYTAERNYEMLLEIYGSVVERKKKVPA
jgi:glycosyltransferase involved in cell wall biosynthesis